MEELVISMFEKYPVFSTVLALLIAGHALALAVVNLTPTPRDDAFVAKLYKVVEWLAGITKKAKEPPKEDEWHT